MQFNRENVIEANKKHYRPYFNQAISAYMNDNLGLFEDILSRMDGEMRQFFQFTQGNDGNTLIHSIATGISESSVSFVDSLQEAVGGDINVSHPNREGKFPIHIAYDFSEIKMIETLLNKGANPNQCIKFVAPYKAYSLVTLCSSHHPFDMKLLRLLNQLDYKLNVPDGSGSTVNDRARQNLEEPDYLAFNAELIANQKKVIDYIDEEASKTASRQRTMARLI